MTPTPYRLENEVLTARFSPVGAALMSLHKRGRPHALVLGFPRANDYRRNPAYLGAVIGRVANRIAGAQFDLNDGDGPRALAANDGSNHLHGGPGGWSHRAWTLGWNTPDALCFTLDDARGAQGYPGNVQARATYRLLGASLLVTLDARTDAPTPLALTTHNYFNLEGDRDVRGHRLWLNSTGFTPVDDALIPTGVVTAQPPHLADLSVPLDRNYCFATPDAVAGTLGHQARLTAANSGLVLDVHSNQRGLQVYNAHAMRERHGAGLRAFAGVALEPQAWPDTPNQPAFGSITLRPGANYRHITRFTFWDTDDAPTLSSSDHS